MNSYINSLTVLLFRFRAARNDRGCSRVKSPVLLLIGASLVLGFTPLAVGQEIIIHEGSPSWEDGNPERDADGDTNGVVVWKGGVVHNSNGSGGWTS